MRRPDDDSQTFGSPSVWIVDADDIARPRSLIEALAELGAGPAPTAAQIEMAKAAVDGRVLLVRRPRGETMPDLPVDVVPRLADQRAA